MSQDRLAQATGIRFRSATNAIAQANRLRRFALVDVEDLVAIENAEAHRLAREVPQALQLGLGRAA
jgi:hypothetical protein